MEKQFSINTRKHIFTVINYVKSKDLLSKDKTRK